ncbi:MAG: DUF4982 domain-containing protein [Bacteroides sp.]|nr:DUF4982 domain-containing protein [Bacteroides sp.]
MRYCSILNFYLLLFIFLVGCTSQSEPDTRRTNFSDDWRFLLGDDASAANCAYDDSAWRKLNLPHDWAIEGDFSPNNPSGTGGGALPGGIGWYRKTFTPNVADSNKRLYIDFDGAYMNATVYINGHELGTRPYGYISFSYDLTPYIEWGKPNVVAVRVDNAEQPNSRWYSGCGIYRHVWLRVLDPIHIAQWGTYVTTPHVTPEEAIFSVQTNVENTTTEAQSITLKSSLIDADGHVVAVAEPTLLTLEAHAIIATTQSLTLANPRLWSVDAPYLYRVCTELISADGHVLDTYFTTTGARYFEFDAVKGFSLNGKPMKINGVCMHHDLGCLGAAINVRALQRQLEILKEMGCNGIRCSHNPPAPELLDLCDQMGFIVMDETFDMWRKRKTAHDYSRYFDEWHEHDLTDLMLRDRNHPSIFMWSIGNEVLEQWSDAAADTLSLEEANMILNFGHSADQLAKADGELSVNALLTRKLADMTRTLDATRPITAGCNEPSPGNHLFRAGALDIIGFNYHDDWFKNVPTDFPGMPFIVTESVSGLMTRGFYRMPSDSVVICPEHWSRPYSDPSFACSSYDNCHVPWGNSHEGTLALVKHTPYISGQYIWTGFDYLGEPTPYGWPARSSYFGVVDLAGFPKDVYYLYQSEWCPDKTVLHLFPHWNWEEGQTVDMWAYYNNADEAELFINGVSQGIRCKLPADHQTDEWRADIDMSTEFHVCWRVTYQPGVVEVVTRKDGAEVARKQIHTAGTPAAIRLTPDRSNLHADGRDLSFVTVEVVDADGNLCPWAEDDIHFSVSGSAFIAGVDNGSQTSMERFKDNHRKAFYGKCLVVLQSDGKRGSIHLDASADGLESAQLTLKAK